MKNTFLFTFSILFLIIIVSYNTKSMGIGLNFPISLGSMVDKYDGSCKGDGNELNSDLNGFGIGFVVDTKVAENELFNYRLNVSAIFGTSTLTKYIEDGKEFELETGPEDLKDSWELDYFKLNIDNTFGFGIVRSKLLRLWVGPQVRLGYSSGTHENNIPYYPLSFLTTKQTIHKCTRLIGFAPVIGANFNFGKTVTLTAETGYRYSVYAFGYMEFENEEITRKTTKKYNLTGHDSEFFFNIGLLFRLDDIYKK